VADHIPVAAAALPGCQIEGCQIEEGYQHGGVCQHGEECQHGEGREDLHEQMAPLQLASLRCLESKTLLPEAGKLEPLVT